MRNAFLLIELANSYAENIRYTKVHPRRHQQAEDKTNIAREEPQLAYQRLQGHDQVANGNAQESTEYYRPAGIDDRSAWQEIRQKRKTQTQRIQPLPEREDDARNEHGRRCQSLEGKGQLLVYELFNATRLPIAKPTVLTICAAVGRSDARMHQQKPSTNPFFGLEISSSN